MTVVAERAHRAHIQLTTDRAARAPTELRVYENLVYY